MHTHHHTYYFRYPPTTGLHYTNICIDSPCLYSMTVVFGSCCWSSILTVPRCLGNRLSPPRQPSIPSPHLAPTPRSIRHQWRRLVTVDAECCRAVKVIQAEGNTSVYIGGRPIYQCLSPTSDVSRPLIGQLARVYDLVCRGKSCMSG